MYSSSYTPLFEGDSGSPIKLAILENGMLKDGVLAVDTMDDNKVVFIANEDMPGLRANGRLKP